MIEKNKFGAVVILAIVFSIGGLFGVGGTVYYLKQSHEDRRQRSERPERSPRDVYRVQVDRMTERLERSLELTEEQIPLVRAEIAKFGNAMREVHEEMKPQFHALMEERSVAIERHLDENQLAAFREERKKHRDRAKSNREGKNSENSNGLRERKPGSGPSACNGNSCSRKTC